MKIERTIGIIKYLILCLAFLYMNKADVFSTSMNIENEMKSEFRNPADEHFHADNYSFSIPESQCRVPRNSNFSISLRTMAKSLRQNSTSQTRNGFTIIKSGKMMNEYTTSLFFKSLSNFPSGMNEPNHHLISLRKLII